MSTQTVKIIDNSARAIFSFLEDMLGDYHPRDFAVRLWDESILNPETGQPPRLTLVLQHTRTLGRLLFPANELSMDEAYIYKDIDIGGDIEGIFGLAEYLTDRHCGLTDGVRYLKHLLDLPSDGRVRSLAGEVTIAFGDSCAPARMVPNWTISYLSGASLQTGARSERAAANTGRLVSKFLITAISSHRENKFG